MKSPVIAVVAGGSGGHITPGITLARTRAAELDGAQIMLLTTASSFDHMISNAQSQNLNMIPLAVRESPRSLSAYPFFCLRLGLAFLQSFFYLCRNRPTELIVMGGYVSLPVCFAAWLLRIPRLMYELNAIPGKAARLLVPFVSRIHICFKAAQEYFPPHKTHEISYPIRFAKPTMSRAQARVQLGLPEDFSTLLVIGGSQGSLFLNTTFCQYIRQNPALHGRISVIHQTGSATGGIDYQHEYAQLNIPTCVFAYQHDLAPYYQAADLVICRAGAGAIFETMFFEKPCILIPLEIPGNDHQVYNAHAASIAFPNLCTYVREHQLKRDLEALTRALLIHTQKRTAR